MDIGASPLTHNNCIRHLLNRDFHLLDDCCVIEVECIIVNVVELFQNTLKLFCQRTHVAYVVHCLLLCTFTDSRVPSVQICKNFKSE